MINFIHKLPRIKRVHRERIELDQSFELIASKFSDMPGTVVLLSGTDLDCARYNILAAMPWLTLTGKRNNYLIRCMDHEIALKADPFDITDALLHRFDLSHDPSVCDGLLPINAGLFGYFAYDLKNKIEILPKTCIDKGLPDIVLYAPSIILVVDRKKNQAFLSIPLISYDNPRRNSKNSVDENNFYVSTIHKHNINESGSKRNNIYQKKLHSDSPYEENLEQTKELFFKTLDSPSPLTDQDFTINNSGFRSNFTRSEYMDGVKKIVEYIRAGDIYQANFSQRFETEFKGNCYSLFLELFKKNPAPFFAFINAETHKILSTSPERFIKRDGNKIETRPIKGTISRGKNIDEDKARGNELLNSLKDDAELSMIVDLMRNDLGKVAKGGSVHVKEHKRLELYDNVFHLVSIVEALLDKDKTSVDLIRATFPGGSITGCPKVRTMEIIDELEPENRHIYTGSIGYLSFHNTLDLSIVIRTAIVSDGVLGLSVGGGIVYDSVPEKEFQETIDKGKTFFETLIPLSSELRENKKYAWVNGRMIGEENAVISANCPGFQYGSGLFETIKVKNGVPFYLKEHMKRFSLGWLNLFGAKPPDIIWKDVVDLVISKNFLNRKTAAVKIMGAENCLIRGKKSLFLAVFARHYIHRLEISDKQGIDLVTYPYPRQTPLADYKTLNYLYYYLALKYAKDKKADEALILNPDGTVSETNTCSIMAISEDKIILPLSRHVLPGVTLLAAVEKLSGSGFKIIKKKIKPKNFFSLKQVILTNSLMGAVPVVSLDGCKIDETKLQDTQRLCNLINTYEIRS